MAGNIDLPWGFGFSGKYSYRSEPYVYGIGMPGDPNENRVPRLIKAADDFKQLDLAIVKYFDVPDIGVGDSQFRVRLDILNVFNEENFADFIGNGGSPDFGQVNNSGIGGNLPRTFKVSVGLSF